MRYLSVVLVLLVVGQVFAVPLLKTQAELIADGELKAKVLSGSQGVPAQSPKVRRYQITRDGKTSEEKRYSTAEIWRLRAFAGEWKDKKGNVMRLARVKSLVPDFGQEYWNLEGIEKGLDELEAKFTGSDEELADWKRLWGGTGPGRFITTKTGARYYVDFVFKERVSDADAEKLLKAFEKSVSLKTSGSGNISSMKWWEEDTPQYRFLTDLDKAKGGRFIKDTMKLIEAMRKSYEFYVPPQKKDIDRCTVRVFRTAEDYRAYLKTTNIESEWSIGIWSPSHEELLVSAAKPQNTQNTMRHEAFHQYLYYATGDGHHARWFDEGHAAFFEYVKYNPAQNTVKITDDGSRARWVAKNLAQCAAAMESVVRMDWNAFYGGDRNLHYCTAWALVYFLEKGAYTSETFEPYRHICADYLAAKAAGASAEEATAKAWAPVANRNLSADFLKFWKEKRNEALKVR